MDEISEAGSAAVADAAGWTVSWLAADGEVSRPVAEIADVAARRKFLLAYEKKYKFDMSKMEEDILSMKEPVFAVRPRVVFGLWEKYFQSKSTRWKFE